MESQGRDGARQENGQNEWHDFENQDARARAPSRPDRTLQTLLPQQTKFVVSRGRRMSLGLEGRQAKARYCVRDIGKGNVEIFENSGDVRDSVYCVEKNER